MAVSDGEVRRRMARLKETCRRRGLKVTHQRTEVFREVAATDQHPDAEAVYQRVRRRVPAISRDTVYRTLATLEGEGLVRRAETCAGPARYDANTEPHHHFVCRECGRVLDFQSLALDRLALPRSVSALGSVESARVLAMGVCRACRGSKGKSRRGA